MRGAIERVGRAGITEGDRHVDGQTSQRETWEEGQVLDERDVGFICDAYVSGVQNIEWMSDYGDH